MPSTVLDTRIKDQIPCFCGTYTLTGKAEIKCKQNKNKQFQRERERDAINKQGKQADSDEGSVLVLMKFYLTNRARASAAPAYCILAYIKETHDES